MMLNQMETINNHCIVAYYHMCLQTELCEFLMKANCVIQTSYICVAWARVHKAFSGSDSGLRSDSSFKMNNYWTISNYLFKRT